MRAFAVAVLLALFFSANVAGNWPLPPHATYPCTPPGDACYQCDDWSKDDAFQARVAERSPRNNASGPDDSGLCNGFNQWCSLPAQIGPISYFFVPGPDGSPRVRFTAPYDFPNAYCQFWDEEFGCRWAVWPIPFDIYDTALDLRVGGISVLDPLSGPPIPAIYENGVWMPTQNAGCGGAVRTFTVRAVNKCNGSVDVNVVVTDPTADDAVCRKVDRDTCPLGVGKPVNVGSGNVRVTENLFTVGGAPQSLPFFLTYHSSKPLYGSLVSTPLSSGWTHSFNETLRGIDPFGVLLYHLSDEGLESVYELGPDSIWRATSPAQLRSTITKSGSQYLLRDLDGTVKSFDVTTGRWLSTTDRWGNALSGSYSGGDLVTVTDSVGRSVSLGYSGGKLASVVIDGHTWRFEYAGGNLSKIFDPLHPGAIPWRSFAYVTDGAGATRLLSEVRDEAGMLREGHAYDAQDRGTTSVAEGGKESVTIEYDVPAPGKTRVTYAIAGGTSQVTEYTLEYNGGRYRATQLVGTCPTCGSSSEAQSFTYDASNHVLTHTDGSGHVTAFSYNADGNVVSQTEAQGTPKERVTTYAYGLPSWPNFVTQITRPSAAKTGATTVTTWAWNASGVPETTLTKTESGYLSASDSTPTLFTTVQTFDASHRLLSVNGPRTDASDLLSYAYYPSNDATLNRRGRLQSSTDAVGLTGTFDDYDVFGTARTATDLNGVVTTRLTDGRGRVTRITSNAVPGDPNEASDYVTMFTFDGRDRLVETTFPRGNRLLHAYEDGTDRLTDTIRVDGSGHEVERRHLTLNTAGDVAMEEDQRCSAPAAPCPAWTTRRSQTNLYDSHRRLAEVQYPVPAGAKVVYTYDLEGRIATVRDENHAAANVLYTYDELDRLATVTQKQVNVPGPDVTTAYGYDVHDNLTSVTDPNGNVTVYAYDDFGRMQSQSSPVTGTTSYTYDPAGNLTSSTDANGATTTRTYDAANRIRSAVSTKSAVATETVTWTYDDPRAGKYGKGRLAEMKDPSGVTVYAYERRGLVREQTQTVQFLTGKGVGDIRRYGMTFSYDANGNRKRVRHSSGLAIDYTFDFADRPASAGSPFATYVDSVQWEPFGPATEIQYGNGTVATRAYDARYRMLTNSLTLEGGPALADYGYTHDAAGNVTGIADLSDGAYSRTFSYDDLNRLRTANASGLWGNGSYTYDAMGNLLTSSIGAATFAYAGTTPKLATVTENGVPRSVNYDAAGNETSVGSATSLYSARNLLASANGYSYTYDGRGMRTIASNAGNERRTSLYGPELQLMSESSFTVAAGYQGHEHHYVWFDGIPVAQVDAPATSPSNVRWTFTDHLGTPLVQTNSTGAVWWRAEYEPFGRIFQMRTPDRHQPLRLPGQEAEQITTQTPNGATDRSYNTFRWYRAGWGRYTQKDPIDWWGLVNPYSYAEENPLRYVDPDGRRVLDRDCASRIADELLVTWAGNDYNDAMRHCIWNCRMSRECGGAFNAWAISEAYEIWYSSIAGGQGFDSGNSDMDRHNNRRGRQCAERPGRCETICGEEARRGGLVTEAPPARPMDPDPSCPSCNQAIR